MKPLITPEQLAQANKILFVTHLALGDFTYLQSFFKAFVAQNPHLEVHVWIDEIRRTRKFWRWNALKNYSIYEWVKACGLFKKVYNETYSPAGLTQSIKNAQKESYDIVISLCSLRPVMYARLTREIAQQAKAYALVDEVPFWNIYKSITYKKLDGALLIKRTEKGRHISDTYATWFRDFFGLEVSLAERMPYIAIPREWLVWAKMRFMKLGFDKVSHKFSKVIFINPFAKTPKRSWPMERVLELISEIKRLDLWDDVSFLINVVPEELKNVEAFFEKNAVNGVHLFSATHSFFQLPAIIAACDIVVTVETSIMHFAAALDIPQVALMRQKNPEWVPLKGNLATIITTHNRNAWIKDIPVKHVMDEFVKRFHASSEEAIYKSVAVEK